MPITEFFLKDVRCFASKQRFRIRPLTFLVGENSTGKSTVLGCMQALANFSQRFRSFDIGYIDFNQPPYQMGSFREIVRKSRPLKDCFEMGMTLQDSKPGSESHIRIMLGERRSGTEPIVTRQTRRFAEFSVVLESTNLNDAESHGKVDVKKRDSSNGPVFHVKLPDRQIPAIVLLRRLLSQQSGEEEPPATHQELLTFLEKDISRGMPFWGVEIESIAPLRSEPKRTYDPVAEMPDPGGSGVPMLLMSLARTDKEEWKSLHKELVTFGVESGLFTDIQVRHLGRSGSDPFQLQIKAQGPKVNLIDTGYGVSQILPILVSILRPRGRMLLVQQPEVHLHPRGQAALASSLVKRLNAAGKGGMGGFVIETHSDYLIDRARIEIRRGNIAPEDVSLIYLEQTPTKGVFSHNITFDNMGNMQQVPPGYRQFFLREADRLFGFEE